MPLAVLTVVAALCACMLTAAAVLGAGPFALAFAVTRFDSRLGPVGPRIAPGLHSVGFSRAACPIAKAPDPAPNAEPRPA